MLPPTTTTTPPHTHQAHPRIYPVHARSFMCTTDAELQVMLPNANYARNDPHNADHDGCKKPYGNGVFSARVQWSVIRVDAATLHAHAADLRFTTSPKKTDTALDRDLLPGFAKAGDCAGQHSALGEIVIDLIGAGFKVAGPSTCTARLLPDGSGAGCSQWTLGGWRAMMTLTCSNNNQRCVLRCGGVNGYCFLSKGHLQLAALDGAASTGTCVPLGRYAPRQLCFCVRSSPPQH